MTLNNELNLNSDICFTILGGAKGGGLHNKLLWLQNEVFRIQSCLDI